MYLIFPFFQKLLFPKLFLAVTILHYPFAADEPTTAFSYAFSEEEEEENEGECKSDEEEAVALRHALAEARVFVVASSSAGITFVFLSVS